jgi:hypothetical protein
MGNNQKIKDVEISLGEMIATLIQSTIDADQAVTDDYLEEFERYAFEKTPNGKSKLTMVDFPAPESPTSAVMRPGSIFMQMLCSAFVPLG